LKRIGAILGTSAQDARQRYGAIVEPAGRQAPHLGDSASDFEILSD